MKILLTLLVTVCFTLPAFSQSAEKKTSSYSSGSADTKNLVFSPIGILAGILNAELDFKLNEHWVIGPKASLLSWSIGDLSVKGSSFGGTGRYYFKPLFTDSWYLSGGLATTSVDLKSGTASATGSGLVMTFIGGYNWFWESFNIQLGLGFSSFSFGKIEVKESNGTVRDSYSPASGALEFNLGFKF